MAFLILLMGFEESLAWIPTKEVNQYSYWCTPFHPHVIARFPTVAEAYAGDKWNYFFTPAPCDALYGVTLPWWEYEGCSPRPEVVHEIIQGVCITAPILRVHE